MCLKQQTHCSHKRVPYCCIFSNRDIVISFVLEAYLEIRRHFEFKKAPQVSEGCYDTHDVELLLIAFVINLHSLIYT